jgi:hypothetical protein
VAESKQRPIVALDSVVLDRYAGRYELAPRIFFDVRRAGDHLEAQLTGQSYLDIFPESETRFFYEDVDAQITFSSDGTKATSLTLHQNGIDQTAPKISDDVPKERVAITLASATLDTYVGKYELARDAIFTIRRSGDRLLAQLTGQQFLQIFPESQNEFFYKAVDAQLTFVKNDKGEVTGLILHQNGIDQTAPRLK